MTEIIFSYATKERMTEALGFWNLSYENGWFGRLSIIDKAISNVIGTWVVTESLQRLRYMRKKNNSEREMEIIKDKNGSAMNYIFSSYSPDRREPLSTEDNIPENANLYM